MGDQRPTRQMQPDHATGFAIGNGVSRSGNVDEAKISGTELGYTLILDESRSAGDLEQQLEIIYPVA
jgi:hypothetical protein